MAHKRMLRILSYEGNEEWIEEFKKKIVWERKGTIREVHCVELSDDKSLNDALREYVNGLP